MVLSSRDFYQSLERVDEALDCLRQSRYRIHQLPVNMVSTLRRIKQSTWTLNAHREILTTSGHAGVSQVTAHASTNRAVIVSSIAGANPEEALDGGHITLQHVMD